MELRARPIAWLIALIAACALVAPAGAAAADAKLPASQSVAPKGYELSAEQATRIADRAGQVRRARAKGRRINPTGYTKGPGRWQVSYFEGPREAFQVQIEDRSGAILEDWGGHQVAWTMARGYEGQFGRSLNAPWLWIPLCVLFVAPFVDPRRPFRLLHLDLLVLLAFSASHFFFNEGEIGVSAPLVAPVLLYLLLRLGVAGFRGRERRQPLIPVARHSWLVAGLVLLVVLRIVLNVVDSEVIDVGYAGVIGADRIADGESLYGAGFSSQVGRGRHLRPGQLPLLPPVRAADAVERELGRPARRPRRGDRVRPAHARGPAPAGPADAPRRGGPHALPGPGLGLGHLPLRGCSPCSPTATTGWCRPSWWLRCSLSRSPPRRSAVGRGLAVGLGAAAKFAPLALAPLMAAGTGERRWRDLAPYAVALLGSIALLALLFQPDGGLRELYDRTLGYQAGRPSPFSPWGIEPSLAPVQTVVKIGAVGLALLVFFVPRRRTLVQVAALGAAVLVALELAATHWFYLYVAWFAPLALVAFLGALRPPITSPHSASGIDTPSVVSRNRVSTRATPGGILEVREVGRVLEQLEAARRHGAVGGQAVLDRDGVVAAAPRDQGGGGRVVEQVEAVVGGHPLAVHVDHRAQGLQERVARDPVR